MNYELNKTLYCVRLQQCCALILPGNRVSALLGNSISTWFGNLISKNHCSSVHSPSIVEGAIYTSTMLGNRTSTGLVISTSGRFENRKNILAYKLNSGNNNILR